MGVFLSCWVAWSCRPRRRLVNKAWCWLDTMQLIGSHYVGIHSTAGVVDSIYSCFLLHRQDDVLPTMRAKLMPLPRLPLEAQMQRLVFGDGRWVF